MEKFSVVGKRLPMVDAVEKASGQALYASDIKLPRMLFGKILRSPCAHAKLLNIDINKARKLLGVKAVITADDTPKQKYGAVFKDQYPLAVEKVRYIGDEVAAVAAVDEDIAKEALELIKVEYEELPAVFDPEEAMRPDAPIIHEGIGNNIAHHIVIEAGETEEAFNSSDLGFEDEFRTHAVQHCCMETQSCVADFDSSGKLTVWANTSTPFNLSQHLSVTLGIPQGRIRIIKPYVGGSFGSKSDYPPHFFCASLLSKITRRPVKIVLTRDEEFTSTRVRHPYIVRLKTGVKRDGKITAFHAKVIMDNGAYSSYGPIVGLQSGTILASLYRVPNIKYDAYLVYTNKAFGGAMRGFGNTQISFAMESQLDMVAEKLKMDPLDLRLKNAVKSGDVSATKWKITSCGFSECLEKSAEAASWKERRAGSKKEGVGIAGMMHHIGFRAGFCDSSSAFVKIRNDNRVYVLSGASDVGQGSNTVLAQIVAEELGLSLDDIVVAAVDTNYSPMDMGTYASRVTVYAGNAVKAAASDLKNQIMEAVARKLGVGKEDLEMRDKRVYVKEAPEKGLSFQDAILACQEFGKGMELLGKGYYDPPTEVIDLNTGYGNYSITYPFGATVAQVSVDTETGEVKVKKLFAAYDIGRAINPMSVEGQIQGACAMGLGYTLSEEVIWENGKILNPNFGDYRMPTAADMPQIESILVEPVDPDGPFGGKGMAEAALVPVAPAIANAIYNAVGVRIKELPITPEKILKALKNRPR